MMLTGSSASPFAAMESAVHRTLFAGHGPYAALAGEGRASDATKGRGEKGAPAAGPPVGGRTLKAKEESEEPGRREKAD